MNDAAIPLVRGRRTLSGRALDAYPYTERSLTRLLRDRAAADPAGTWVVVDGEERLTLGDAWTGARRVAAALARDAPPRPHVGIATRSRPEFLVALHGVLLAGGTAFPLNPGLGADQLAGQLGVARLDVLVADAEATPVPATAPVVPSVVVGLDGAAGIPWDDWTATAPVPDTVSLADAADPALVLFTSGTTGTPKGVLCSHAWAFAYGALVADSLERTADDVVTGSMPLFHSAGLHVVVHSALHGGCRAHVWSRFSASQWWQQVADDGATHAAILGPMAEMVLRRVERAPEHRLRTAQISAFANREEFARRYGVEVLWQGYGMTEVYPVPMPRRMSPGPDDLLGVPVDRYDIGVVDEHDRPVAPGGVGELVVRPRAPGLRFDGYLDDPAATDAAWRGGAFHTGDLVSYDESTGGVRFRGRRADRIRRRGENVDPVIVEDAALAFPGVLEAAAFGVPSDLGEDDVKLDVVAAADETVDLAALRDWLATRLSRPACPRYLEQRPALPRNASHRVERTRLREDGVDRPGVHDAERAPT